MKNLTGLFACLLLTASCAVAKDYDVRAFGAKGDGVSMNTEAIQRAIDACSAAGGGRVVLESGRYMTGTILLKDGVDLHLEVDAVLMGSSDWQDWRDQPQAKHVRQEMCPRKRTACLVFADEARQVAITGRGTIDANGASFVEPIPGDHDGLQYRRKLPLTQSPPRVVFFAGCEDVRVEEITLRDPPAGWSFWVHDCDRVSFDRVNVLTNVEYPNNDGIHVNCSRDVTIANCRIETGDDSIIVRANSASLAQPKPCERVTVVNCSLRSYANAIRIGWLNDGVIRNCTFANLTVTDSANGIGIVLPKWNPRDNMPDQGVESSLIENLVFSNVTMDRLLARPVQIEIDPGAETLCTAIRNIRFMNMSVRGLEYPVVRGREANPIEDVTFSACSFVREDDKDYPPWRKQGFASILRRPGLGECLWTKNLVYDRVTWSGR